MSHAHAAGEELKPHVLPIRVYLGIWIALMILTWVTVEISYHHFGPLNIVIAMGVATVKATLVALFFMHLKYDEKFNQIFFVSTLIFLGIFVALTMADTAERGRVDPIEAKEILLVPSRPDAGHAVEGQGEATDPAAAGATDAKDGGDGH